MRYLGSMGLLLSLRCLLRAHGSQRSPKGLMLQRRLESEILTQSVCCPVDSGPVSLEMYGIRGEGSQDRERSAALGVGELTWNPHAICPGCVVWGKLLLRGAFST